MRIRPQTESEELLDAAKMTANNDSLEALKDAENAPIVGPDDDSVVEAEFTEVPNDPPVSTEEIVAAELVKADDTTEEEPKKKHNLDPLFEQSSDVEFVDWQLGIKEKFVKFGEELTKLGNQLKARTIAFGNDVNGIIANVRSADWRRKQTFLASEWYRDRCNETVTALSNLRANLFDRPDHADFAAVVDTLYERIEASEKQALIERKASNARIATLEGSVRKLTRALNREQGNIGEDNIELLDKLLAAVKTGQNAVAIASYRTLTGCPLADAKKTIEGMTAN